MQRSTPTRIPTCLLLLTALGACAASESEPVTEADQIRAVRGSTITSEGTPILKAARARGEFNDTTGAITVTTASGTFESDGGPVGGVYTASNGDEAQVFDTSQIAGSYDHMLPLTVTIDVNGTNHVSQGVFGSISPAAIMTSSTAFGTAIFNGEAAITSQNTVTGAVRHRSSDTRVTANFAAGTVDISMDSISPIAGAAATIDDIDITGATIAGSGYTGGTASVTLSGANALPAITNGGELTSVDGHFFGTSGQLPDETGGVMLVEGNDGSVSAVFVAD